MLKEFGKTRTVEGYLGELSNGKRGKIRGKAIYGKRLQSGKE